MKISRQQLLGEALLLVAFFMLSPSIVKADNAFILIDHAGTVLQFDSGSYEQADLCAATNCGSGSLELIASVPSGTLQSCLTTPGCFGGTPALVTGLGAGTYYVVYSTSSASPNYSKFVTLIWDGTNWQSQNSTVDWGAIYIPTVFSTSSTAIGTSSSLWGSLDIASSSINCTSGNIFSNGICAAVSYLFVPNPNVLNATIAIPQVATTKFPFSWVYGIQQSISTLSATNTSQMGTYSIDWSAMNIGTSSPLGLSHIAPASTTVFSKNTIETYIPDSTWQLFQALIAAGIWLTFAADVFFTARNQMHRV